MEGLLSLAIPEELLKLIAVVPEVQLILLSQAQRLEKGKGVQ